MRYEVGGLRCDLGGEYTSQLFKTYAESQGVTVTYTGSHSPAQHGRAERVWRTMASSARCMLEEAGLPLELWA